MDAGRAALDISQQINNMWAQVYSVLNLNHALLEIGEYEEALRVTQQGVEMARTLPNPTLLFFVLTVLGARCNKRCCGWRKHTRRSESRWL